MSDKNDASDSGRSYEILPRPEALGGGWRLILRHYGKEAGGGVFPIHKEGPQATMDWWRRLTMEERGYWLVKALSHKPCDAKPEDARHAYLSEMAYDDALQVGEDWIAP